jgi:SHS2 domain-containing protein
MKKYEILEHKADLKIKIFGKTKEELFCNALLGMKENMKPEIQRSKDKIIREIRVKSPDLPALLIDFLSEALYLGQSNKEVYSDIKFRKFSDNSSINSEQAELEAELFGQKVERFGEDIKAATYHQLDINQKKDGTWEAIVIFDV